VHLASGRDVSYHSGAWLEVMALVVNGAATNAFQYEFRTFRVAKIQVDFDAAERLCNLIDNPRNQFFKIESGGDPLCEFLQPHKFGDPECGRFGKRLARRAEIHERAGGHYETLLPIDGNWTFELSYKIAGIRFRILFLFGFLLDLMCGWMPAA